MFPLRYFSKRFWAGRLFPPSESEPSPPGSGGGPFSPRYFVKRFFYGRYFPPASAGAGTATGTSLQISAVSSAGPSVTDLQSSGMTVSGFSSTGLQISGVESV